MRIAARPSEEKMYRTASVRESEVIDMSEYEQNRDRSSGSNPYIYSNGSPYYSQNEASNMQQQAPQKKNSSGTFRKLLISTCMGLCFGLFAGIGYYAVDQATGALNTTLGRTEGAEEIAEEAVENGEVAEADHTLSTESGTTLQTTQKIVTTASTDVTEVAEAVMPSMVAVTEYYTYDYGYSMFGQKISEDVSAAGSGIIIGETDDEYLIVTNNHVVTDAESLEVTFADDSTVEANIKGTDSSKDLAIIAVAKDALSSATKGKIAIATIGDSSLLKLGENVVAIGNALGYGQSVTTGIVSALNREVTTEDGYTNTFIQTDAAINPGNSGGALLNMSGQVIGINSNKVGGTSVEGMGYAIPISDVLDILDDLMSQDTLIRVAEDEIGYIGISLQEITAEMAQTFDMPQGIYIKETVDGGAAEQAGMVRGDIITGFNGRTIRSYDDLQGILQYYAAGTTVTITYQRQENGTYVEYNTQLTLGRRPAQQ